MDISAGSKALALVNEASKNLILANENRRQGFKEGFSDLSKTLINYDFLKEDRDYKKKKNEYQGYLNTIAQAKADNVNKEIQNQNDMADEALKQAKITTDNLDAKLKAETANTKARTGFISEQKKGLRLTSAKEMTDTLNMYKLMGDTALASQFLGNFHGLPHKEQQSKYRFRYGGFLTLPKALR